MQPKEQIKELPVYKPGKPISEVKREYNLTQVIKLASNENPFGHSPNVLKAIRDETLKIGVYPDGAAYELRSALAEHYKLDNNRFVFGNGSDEVISFISRVYLTKGTNTIMATPTFSMYKLNAMIEEAEVIEVPLVNGTHDLDNMKAQVNEQTRVLWICNPNNPSGTYNSYAELADFLKEMPDHVLVVLDEAYCEYVTAEDYSSAIPLMESHPNLIVLRTFSKIYGLAALRIGYGIGSPKVIDLLNRVRAPFNSSSVAQVAAIAALEDQRYVESCREKNRLGLEQVYKACEELGLFYYPSEGNFILIDMKRPGNEVFEELLKRGIIVRSGEALGFPTFIRITIGSEEQNNEIISALSELVMKGVS
jgi:histidinol-phosphate aminotransferase